MQRYRLEIPEVGQPTMVQDPAGEYVTFADASTIQEDLLQAQARIIVLRDARDAARSLADQLRDQRNLLRDAITQVMTSIDEIEVPRAVRLVARRLMGSLTLIRSRLNNAGVTVHKRNENYGGTARAEVR